MKVDFFGGDGQSVIAYYHDILEDAAAFGLLVNFHGATLPRGWERTYPNLMTMEAVRGLEYVTFGQDNADAEPSHAAMLPFTRNVFDPMDFTPDGARPHPPHPAADVERVRARAVGAVHVGHSALRGDSRRNGEGAGVRPRLSARRAQRVGRRALSRRLSGPVCRHGAPQRRRWFVAGINADSTRAYD